MLFRKLVSILCCLSIALISLSSCRGADRDKTEKDPELVPDLFFVVSGQKKGVFCNSPFEKRINLFFILLFCKPFYSILPVLLQAWRQIFQLLLLLQGVFLPLPHKYGE